MLNWIVLQSLRFRRIVTALAALIIAYGISVTMHAKLDVFPEFVQPQVTVQAEAPGLAPEQVEALVTRPVEAAINGAGDLEFVRSESIPGLSAVTALFREGTNVFTARQTLAEKLAETAGHLPDGVKAPTMSPLTSSTMDLLKIGLLSDVRTPMELRSFADWTLRPRLLSVPGIAHINVYGGEVRQLQVQIHPDRLIAYDLTIDDILKAARAGTGVRGAGFVETPAQRILILSEAGSLTAEDLGNIPITQQDGASVRLRDVADVVNGAEPKFGDSLIQGKPGVLLTMASQYGANTMEVTKAVEQALDEMKPLFESEKITLFSRIHRPATFIQNALKNVKRTLLYGAALVAIVLVLFLLDLRTAFVSFISIPLSLLTAVIMLDWWGVTLNTMTLGGFAVAIGVVVDDAIIDVENILRRLRENRRLPVPRPVLPVVLDASLEVRSAVVYATVVVALVFVPVLIMSGLQGRFFAPLGMAFMLAAIASLVVALTVTPALCLLLLSRTDLHAEPRYLRWLKGWHRGVLVVASEHPRATFSTALLLIVASAAAVPFFGHEFLPDFREGHFVIQVTAAPGTSLPEMIRIGGKISEEILKNEHVAAISQQVGRAEAGEDTWGPHQCEFHVELKPGTSDEADVQADFRERLKKFPGIQSEVVTFLGDRISETLSGETAQVVINVFGDDLDVIDAKAREVADVLRTVPGAADVQVKSPPGGPLVTVRLRPERLTQFGFRPLDVLETIQTAYQGTDVAQLYEGNHLIELNCILEERSRRDPETIGSLLLSNAAGVRLPLRQLADIALTTGRYRIQHEGARRRQTITCNPHDRDVESFVADAKHRIFDKVTFPTGVYLGFGGAAEAQASARRELYWHGLLAFAAIILVLSMVFRNSRNLLLVLVNIPFALVGGVFAVCATGGTLSLGSLVGFVTLFGISMRNSIMMISHFEHLVRTEGHAWNLETALRGAGERLVPIMMTALVTGLGLLPLAFGADTPGSEIESPMAIVILGGLVTSTVLNLLVLPSLALRFGRFDLETDAGDPAEIGAGSAVPAT